jgi:CHASE3 domain sensor protein
MKLGTKILALVGIMVIAMAGLGVYNLLVTNRVAQSSKDLYNYNLMGVQDALEAKAAFLHMSSYVRDHILYEDPESMNKAEDNIALKRKEVEQYLKEYESSIVYPKEREILADIRGHLNDYDASVPELIRYSNAGQKSEAAQVLYEKL